MENILKFKHQLLKKDLDKQKYFINLLGINNFTQQL